MGYTMGYICQKLWDIFVKLWDLFRDYGIYISQKLWDILGFDYRLYYWIYLANIMGYIGLIL